MWCPTIYFFRRHGPVWGVWGCLSFRIVNQLQWSILSICFYAHNNYVILHEGYCINDQSACALHSLTTFSTWNNFWILSSLGTAVHGLLNFKSGPCIFSVSKMSSLKAETTLVSDLCSWVKVLSFLQSICGNSMMDLQDSLQLSPSRRSVVVEWTEPSATRNSCAFPFAYLLPAFLFANVENCGAQFCQGNAWVQTGSNSSNETVGKITFVS